MKEWSIEELELWGTSEMAWNMLAKVAARGKLGGVSVWGSRIQTTREEDLRAVWNVTEGELIKNRESRRLVRV